MQRQQIERCIFFVQTFIFVFRWLQYGYNIRNTTQKTAKLHKKPQF